ncbi:hypothetical protein [Hydrogenophaga sp. T2]|uniref:hypothetical protein n=1 Tax=Hydrogenophaga sp. T2 TaxID=3132823 RepID=UPI003CF11229
MFGMFETARPGRAWGRSGLAAVALGIAAATPAPAQTPPQTAAALPTVLRLLCEEAAAGAAVTLNGEARGECPADGPLDLIVVPGNYRLRAAKPAGPDQERVFEKELRILPGTLPRQEVLLGTARPTADAQRRQAEQQALAEQAREKALRERAAIERPIDDALAAHDARHGLFCFAVQRTSWRHKRAVSPVWETPTAGDKGRPAQLAALRGFVEALHAADNDWFAWSGYAQGGAEPEPRWDRPTDTASIEGALTAVLVNARQLSFGRGIEEQDVTQRCYSTAEQAHLARRWYAGKMGSLAVLPPGSRPAPPPQAVTPGRLFCTAAVRVGDTARQVRSGVWTPGGATLTDQQLFNAFATFSNAVQTSDPAQWPAPMRGPIDGTCDVKPGLSSKCVARFESAGRKDIQGDIACLPDAMSAFQQRQAYKAAALRDKVVSDDVEWAPAGATRIERP